LSAVTAFTYDFWQYGSRAARKLIDFLEGDTVVETVRRMARRWKGCMVKFYIDNMVFEKSGRALAVRAYFNQFGDLEFREAVPVHT
jgi:hypothetical protein